MARILSLCITANEPDTVIAKTDKLFFLNPATGRKHMLGSFELYLPTRRPRIHKPRFFNRTHLIWTGQQYQHAPHVDQNGVPALGNVETAFEQLIARAASADDFPAAYQEVAALAVAFLETVNPAAIGDIAEMWPLAQEG